MYKFYNDLLKTNRTKSLTSYTTAYRKVSSSGGTRRPPDNDEDNNNNEEYNTFSKNIYSDVNILRQQFFQNEHCYDTYMLGAKQYMDVVEKSLKYHRPLNFSPEPFGEPSNAVETYPLERQRANERSRHGKIPSKTMGSILTQRSTTSPYQPVKERWRPVRGISYSPQINPYRQRTREKVFHVRYKVTGSGYHWYSKSHYNSSTTRKPTVAQQSFKFSDKELSFEEPEQVQEEKPKKVQQTFVMAPTQEIKEELVDIPEDYSPLRVKHYKSHKNIYRRPVWKKPVVVTENTFVYNDTYDVDLNYIHKKPSTLQVKLDGTNKPTVSTTKPSPSINETARDGQNLQDKPRKAKPEPVIHVNGEQFVFNNRHQLYMKNDAMDNAKSEKNYEDYVKKVYQGMNTSRQVMMKGKSEVAVKKPKLSKAKSSEKEVRIQIENYSIQPTNPPRNPSKEASNNKLIKDWDNKGKSEQLLQALKDFQIDPKKPAKPSKETTDPLEVYPQSEGNEEQSEQNESSEDNKLETKSVNSQLSRGESRSNYRSDLEQQKRLAKKEDSDWKSLGKEQHENDLEFPPFFEPTKKEALQHQEEHHSNDLEFPPFSETSTEQSLASQTPGEHHSDDLEFPPVEHKPLKTSGVREVLQSKAQMQKEEEYHENDLEFPPFPNQGSQLEDESVNSTHQKKVQIIEPNIVKDEEFVIEPALETYEEEPEIMTKPKPAQQQEITLENLPREATDVPMISKLPLEQTSNPVNEAQIFLNNSNFKNQKLAKNQHQVGETKSVYDYLKMVAVKPRPEPMTSSDVKIQHPPAHIFNVEQTKKTLEVEGDSFDFKPSSSYGSECFVHTLYANTYLLKNFHDFMQMDEEMSRSLALLQDKGGDGVKECFVNHLFPPEYLRENFATPSTKPQDKRNSRGGKSSSGQKRNSSRDSAQQQDVNENSLTYSNGMSSNKLVISQRKKNMEKERCHPKPSNKSKTNSCMSQDKKGVLFEAEDKLPDAMMLQEEFGSIENIDARDSFREIEFEIGTELKKNDELSVDAVGAGKGVKERLSGAVIVGNVGKHDVKPSSGKEVKALRELEERRVVKQVEDQAKAKLEPMGGVESCAPTVHHQFISENLDQESWKQKTELAELKAVKYVEAKAKLNLKKPVSIKEPERRKASVNSAVEFIVKKVKKVVDNLTEEVKKMEPKDVKKADDKKTVNAVKNVRKVEAIKWKDLAAMRKTNNENKAASEVFTNKPTTGELKRKHAANLISRPSTDGKNLDNTVDSAVPLKSIGQILEEIRVENEEKLKNKEESSVSSQQTDVDSGKVSVGKEEVYDCVTFKEPDKVEFESNKDLEEDLEETASVKTEQDLEEIRAAGVNLQETETVASEAASEEKAKDVDEVSTMVNFQEPVDLASNLTKDKDLEEVSTAVNFQETEGIILEHDLTKDRDLDEVSTQETETKILEAADPTISFQEPENVTLEPTGVLLEKKDQDLDEISAREDSTEPNYVQMNEMEVTMKPNESSSVGVKSIDHIMEQVKLGKSVITEEEPTGTEVRRSVLEEPTENIKASSKQLLEDVEENPMKNSETSEEVKVLNDVKKFMEGISKAVGAIPKEVKEAKLTECEIEGRKTKAVVEEVPYDQYCDSSKSKAIADLNMFKSDKMENFLVLNQEASGSSLLKLRSTNDILKIISDALWRQSHEEPTLGVDRNCSVVRLVAEALAKASTTDLDKLQKPSSFELLETTLQLKSDDIISEIIRGRMEKIDDDGESRDGEGAAEGSGGEKGDEECQVKADETQQMKFSKHKLMNLDEIVSTPVAVNKQDIPRPHPEPPTGRKDKSHKDKNRPMKFPPKPKSEIKVAFGKCLPKSAQDKLRVPKMNVECVKAIPKRLWLEEVEVEVEESAKEKMNIVHVTAIPKHERQRMGRYLAEHKQRNQPSMFGKLVKPNEPITKSNFGLQITKKPIGKEEAKKGGYHQAAPASKLRTLADKEHQYPHNSHQQKPIKQLHVSKVFHQKNKPEQFIKVLDLYHHENLQLDIIKPLGLASADFHQELREEAEEIQETMKQLSGFQWKEPEKTKVEVEPSISKQVLQSLVNIPQPKHQQVTSLISSEVPMKNWLDFSKTDLVYMEQLDVPRVVVNILLPHVTISSKSKSIPNLVKTRAKKATMTKMTLQNCLAIKQSAPVLMTKRQEGSWKKLDGNMKDYGKEMEKIKDDSSLSENLLCKTMDSLVDFLKGYGQLDVVLQNDGGLQMVGKKPHGMDVARNKSTSGSSINNNNKGKPTDGDPEDELEIDVIQLKNTHGKKVDEKEKLEQLNPKIVTVSGTKSRGRLAEMMLKADMNRGKLKEELVLDKMTDKSKVPVVDQPKPMEMFPGVRKKEPVQKPTEPEPPTPKPGDFIDEILNKLQNNEKPIPRTYQGHKNYPQPIYFAKRNEHLESIVILPETISKIPRELFLRLMQLSEEEQELLKKHFMITQTVFEENVRIIEKYMKQSDEPKKVQVVEDKKSEDVVVKKPTPLLGPKYPLDLQNFQAPFQPPNFVMEALKKLMKKYSQVTEPKKVAETSGILNKAQTEDYFKNPLLVKKISLEKNLADDKNLAKKPEDTKELDEDQKSVEVELTGFNSTVGVSEKDIKSNFKVTVDKESTSEIKKEIKREEGKKFLEEVNQKPKLEHEKSGEEKSKVMNIAAKDLNVSSSIETPEEKSVVVQKADEEKSRIFNVKAEKTSVSKTDDMKTSELDDEKMSTDTERLKTKSKIAARLAQEKLEEDVDSITEKSSKLDEQQSVKDLTLSEKDVKEEIEDPLEGNVIAFKGEHCEEVCKKVFAQDSKEPSKEDVVEAQRFEEETPTIFHEKSEKEKKVLLEKGRNLEEKSDEESQNLKEVKFVPKMEETKSFKDETLNKRSVNQKDGVNPQKEFKCIPKWPSKEDLEKPIEDQAVKPVNAPKKWIKSNFVPNFNAQPMWGKPTDAPKFDLKKVEASKENLKEIRYVPIEENLIEIRYYPKIAHRYDEENFLKPVEERIRRDLQKEDDKLKKLSEKPKKIDRSDRIKKLRHILEEQNTIKISLKDKESNTQVKKINYIAKQKEENTMTVKKPWETLKEPVENYLKPKEGEDGNKIKKIKRFLQEEYAIKQKKSREVLDKLKNDEKVASDVVKNIKQVLKESNKDYVKKMEENSEMKVNKIKKNPLESNEIAGKTVAELKVGSRKLDEEPKKTNEMAEKSHGKFKEEKAVIICLKPRPLNRAELSPRLKEEMKPPETKESVVITLESNFFNSKEGIKAQTSKVKNKEESIKDSGGILIQLDDFPKEYFEDRSDAGGYIMAKTPTNPKLPNKSTPTNKSQDKKFCGNLCVPPKKMNKMAFNKEEVDDSINLLERNFEQESTGGNKPLKVLDVKQHGIPLQSSKASMEIVRTGERFFYIEQFPLKLAPKKQQSNFEMVSDYFRKKLQEMPREKEKILQGKPVDFHYHRRPSFENVSRYFKKKFEDVNAKGLEVVLEKNPKTNRKFVVTDAKDTEEDPVDKTGKKPNDPKKK